LDYAVRHVHSSGAVKALKTCCWDDRYQWVTDYV